jgi:hypothetical protein
MLKHTIATVSAPALSSATAQGYLPPYGGYAAASLSSYASCHARPPHFGQCYTNLFLLDLQIPVSIPRHCHSLPQTSCQRTGLLTVTDHAALFDPHQKTWELRHIPDTWLIRRQRMRRCLPRDGILTLPRLVLSSAQTGKYWYVTC